MSKKRNYTIYKPNCFYHVYNRGNRKELIFFNVMDYSKFLQILDEKAKKVDLIVYGYCLMPNHFHLLIKLGFDLGDVSTFMQSSMTSYSKFVNKRYHIVGRLFQGPFMVKRLDGVEDVLKVIKYFQNNPVKAGLVKNYEDYRWLRISLNTKEECSW